MTLLPVFLRRLAPGVWSTNRLALDAAEQVQARAWDVIDVDLGGITTREGQLARLGTAGSFPDYYGHNLDAAYDCLTDLAWRSPMARVMLVRGKVDAAVQKVLDDAVVHWANSPTPLWVVIEKGDAPSLDKF
jgi:RNAse (barnase) inhibitor barstar